MTATAAIIGRGLRYPAGFKHLDRFAGGSNSPRQQFHYFQAWRDAVFEFHDFRGPALVSGTLTANAGTGATAFAVPATPLVGGALSGVTGTDGTSGNRVTNLYGSPIWQGTKNCGMEVRFKVSSASAIHFSMGWMDTYTTITTPNPLIADIDTPTYASGAGDFAVVAMDTTQTLTTMALCTLGSTPYAAATTAIGTLVPTAATYMTVRIQLVGSSVFVTIDDATANFVEVARALSIATGTLVRPYIDVHGTSATSKTMDIDYIAIWQDR